MHKLVKKIITSCGNFLFYFRKKEIIRSDIKKILIISLYFRGDVLFNTGAIRVLKKILPEARIDVLVKSRSKEILEGNPNIHRIITFDEIKTADYNDHKGLSPGKKISLLKKLRKEKYDLCIDLTGKYSTALLSLMGKFRYSTGLNYNGFGFCYSKFIDIETQKTPGHLSEKYIRVVKRGLSADDSEGPENNDFVPAHEIFLSQTDIDEAEEKLKEAGISKDKPLICIQPTAGWRAKELSQLRYAALLKKFISLGYDFVFIGSEEDEQTNLRILDTAGPELRKYFLQLPLKINAAVISLSDVFIGSDSIGLHLACALNTPSIGLFGPTNPVFSAPTGSIHRIIYKKFDCSASDDDQYCTRNAGKTCLTIDCMNQITADEIAENTDQLLKEFYFSKRIMA